MVTKWVFFDPVSLDTQTFEINPSDGDAVPRSKNVTTQSRRAPGGNTVVVMNSQGLREFTNSGTILTEAQYGMFTDWFSKPNVIQITDDLGRTYSIYITKFEPKREWHPNDPWFHTYTLTGIVVQ